MHILGLALAIVGSLLATTAGAQTSCAPDGRPIDPDYENDTFAEWPQEAQRFKNNGELVSRQRDRLRLVLDGGKSIELVDCPYGDDAYHFLYERYDQAGRFYVVRKSCARRLLLCPGDDADRARCSPSTARRSGRRRSRSS